MVNLTWDAIDEHIDKGDLREWLKEERAKDKARQLSEKDDTPQTDCPQSNICAKPCKECGACEEECGMWKALNKLQTEQHNDCQWK